MNFPRWADAPGMSKAKRASGRLRYILLQLSIEHTGRSSVRSLASQVGLDHSTLSKYVKQGAFTESSASQVVLRLGCAPSMVSMLTTPLAIGKGTE